MSAKAQIPARRAKALTRGGDLTDLHDGVCDGMDAVIFAAGSGGFTGANITDKLNRDGAKWLIDLARNAGVKRFLMLSSVGIDQTDSTGELVRDLKAKQAADEHLMASGLTYAFLRPVALTNDARGSLACHNPVGRPVRNIIRLRDYRLCISTSRFKSSVSHRSPFGSECVCASASRILMAIGHGRSAARNYLAIEY